MRLCGNSSPTTTSNVWVIRFGGSLTERRLDPHEQEEASSKWPRDAASLRVRCILYTGSIEEQTSVCLTLGIPPIAAGRRRRVLIRPIRMLGTTSARSAWDR